MEVEGFGDEALTVPSAVSFMLGPLSTLYRQNIDRIVQPYGISAGQAPLLMMLTSGDGQCQKDLALKLGIKPSSLTTMLNRMEKAGVIVRQKSATDQRSYHVYMTAKGRRAAKKLKAVIRFINERNLAGFRNEEKILFLRFMEQMAKNMEKQKEELALIREDEMLLKEYRDAQEI